MSAAAKRKSPGRGRGSDSWQNLATNIPHPLAFSSEKGERGEVFRLALAALTPAEFDEWAGGFGIAEVIKRKVSS